MPIATHSAHEREAHIVDKGVSARIRVLGPSRSCHALVLTVESTNIGGKHVKNLLKSKRARVAVIVGGALGIVGIALAAFVLTATVSGGVTFRDQDADFRVAASGTVGTNGMDCTNTGITDGNNISVNPVIARFTSPGQPPQVPAQRCTVAVRIDNTGDVPLGVNGNFSAPAGITPAFTGGPGNGVIAAGSGADYTITLTVADGSQPAQGPISGQLQLTSAPGAQ